MALILTAQMLKNKFQKAMESKEKNEVLKILRSGESIPPDFAMFIADILDNKTRFKAGRKIKPVNVHDIDNKVKMILDLEDFLDSELQKLEFDNLKETLKANPEFCREQNMTATDFAIDTMAFKYGVSFEKMKACVYGHRNLVTKKRKNRRVFN